jgi:hypothetical protein
VVDFGPFSPPQKKLGFVYVALPSYLLPGCENLSKNKKTKTPRRREGRTNFVCMFGFQFQVSNFEFMNRYI